ncbi:MAG: outer membrane protein, partial [Bacteroidales bacterium]
MKKIYQPLAKTLIVILMFVVPMLSIAQTKSTEATKKEAEKTKTSKCSKASTYSYWSVTAYGSLNQFNGDLSKNVFFNDKWMFGAGGMVTKQFTRVIGARFRGGWVPLQASVTDKYVPLEAPLGSDGKISQNFKSWVIEADLEATINWVNWIMGYKPERFFSSYLIAGFGIDHTQGVKYENSNPNLIIGYLGYGRDADQDGVGNNSGIGGWNMEFKAVAGLGFDFNLSEHWSINPEILWRWRSSDYLDLSLGGDKQVINDMYSGINLGLTYKFSGGCNLKNLAKDYDLVKYETTPAVLTEKGDSVVVTIKGTVPPKFLCPTAAMYFQPVLTYQGGQYEMPCGTHVYGEKLSGTGTMIKYKEGGSFSYTCVFPYKPEMNTSMLSVTPIVYEAKEKVLLKKDEIKVKAKFMEMPKRDLAPGIIYT